MKLMLKREMIRGVLVAGLIACGWAANAETKVWIPLPDLNSASVVKQTVERAGGTVLELAPEGRILASFPGDVKLPAKFQAQQYSAPVKVAAQSDLPDLSVLDADAVPVPAKADLEKVNEMLAPYKAPEPNEVSKARAVLSGMGKNALLPSRVDNSVSQYFPPVGNAGSQTSAVSWATAYYQNTFVQSKDEGLMAFAGDTAALNSPAFNYNLINMGQSSIDSGPNADPNFDRSFASYMEYSLYKLQISGCGSMVDMPYSETDYLSWPTEKAWTNGLKNRIDSFSRLGDYTNALTDADITSIKQELANGRLLSARMTVYPGFSRSFDPSGNLRPDTPANEVSARISNSVFYNQVTYDGSGMPEDPSGSTAFSIVGYDDFRIYPGGRGAFLMAGSLGTNFGFGNAVGTRGYIWVSYALFKNPSVFGVAFTTQDKPQYRPRVWASCAIDAQERGWISMWGGFGSGDINNVEANYGSHDWHSLRPIDRDGGTTMVLPLISDEPVVVDLTDGIQKCKDFSTAVAFVGIECNQMSDYSNQIGKTTFYYDLAATGNPTSQSIADTPSLDPGQIVTRKIAMPMNVESPLLVVTNPGRFDTTGSPLGSFTPDSKVYVLQNASGTEDLNYAVSVDVPWLKLDKSSGFIKSGESDTLRATVVQNVANTYAVGQYTGYIWLVKNTPNEEDELTCLEARLIVTPLALEYFLFNTVDVPQKPGVGFPMQCRAMDILNETCGAYNDYASIVVKEKMLRLIGGAGSEPWEYPFNSYFKRARTQSIYLASEMPCKGSITQMRVNVADFGGELRNFAVRMRHTSLSSYNKTEWQGSDWQTVYQCDSMKFNTNGWQDFYLSTPFVYDGVHNLMVDFSFDNLAWNKPTVVRASDTLVSRSLIAAVDEFTTVPTGWGVSSLSPVPEFSTYVPNLHVFVEGDVMSALPAAEQLFSLGVWRGPVTVMKPSDNVVIQAVDRVLGKTGETNIFSVINVPVIDVTPTALNVTTVKGKVPDPQTFLLRNIGNGALNFNVSVNASWLSATPGAGSITNEVQRVTVQYNTAALPVGVYNAAITIVDSVKPGVLPVSIPVRLTVTAH